MRLVLALAERDPDSLDMYHGPAAWRADAQALRARLDDIQRSARNLVDLLAAERDVDTVRRDFLVRQLRAVGARVEILKGARPKFDDEARELFGIEAGPPGAPGSPGPLDSSDERAFLVPPHRVRAVLARAVEGCRAATIKHIALPSSERVTLEYVPDLAWSAFTDYLGQFRSRIRVNARVPLTVDGALELACHEAYPGHHTINTLLESRFTDRRTEFLVQPLFSPQSLLHEGAASVAPSLAFTEADRIAFERDQLFPLAGLDPAGAERSVKAGLADEQMRGVEVGIIRQYLDGELDFPRASAALAREAPGSSPDDMLKFANQFRTYVATYLVGRERVSSWLDERGPGADRSARWRAYVALATRAEQVLPQ